MPNRRNPPKGYRDGHCFWCGCKGYLPTTAAATATFKCDECEQFPLHLVHRREGLYRAALREAVPFMVRARQAGDGDAEEWLDTHEGILWLLGQRR